MQYRRDQTPQPLPQAPAPRNPTPVDTPQSPSLTGTDYPQTSRSLDFAPSSLTDQGSNQTPDINSVANSTGGTGFGSVPDFSSNPKLQADLLKALGDYVYSVPAGGYISAADARNANSYYNKFGAGGGGDPGANRVMEQLYGQVGNLPTRPVESSALAKLYQSGAATRAPATGPSFNQTLSEVMQGPLGEAARDAGFTDRYRGFWDFGHRQPYYNPYGQYHPPPGGGY